MNEYKRIRVKLALVATCPSCQLHQAVRASGTCPKCGTSLPAEEVAAVRSAIRSRRLTFKGRLNRLVDSMRDATDAPLVFATRGTPQSKLDYFNKVLQPATKTIQVRHDAITKLLATGEWVPDDPNCITTFTELVMLLEAEISSIAQLSQTMPPLELRGVHRELTRSVAQFARGHVATAQTICAVDADDAVHLMNVAASEITEASKHLERLLLSSGWLSEARVLILSAQTARSTSRRSYGRPCT